MCIRCDAAGTDDVMEEGRSQDVYMALENDLYGSGDYSTRGPADLSAADAPTYAEPSANGGATLSKPYESPRYIHS